LSKVEENTEISVFGANTNVEQDHVNPEDNKKAKNVARIGGSAVNAFSGRLHIPFQTSTLQEREERKKGLEKEGDKPK
jgi:hypothetical protein